MYILYDVALWLSVVKAWRAICASRENASEGKGVASNYDRFTGA